MGGYSRSPATRSAAPPAASAQAGRAQARTAAASRLAMRSLSTRMPPFFFPSGERGLGNLAPSILRHVPDAPRNVRAGFRGAGVSGETLHAAAGHVPAVAAVAQRVLPRELRAEEKYLRRVVHPKQQ